MARILAREMQCMVLPVDAVDGQYGRANLELLKNTLSLYSLSRVHGAQVHVIVQRGASLVTRVLLLRLWRKITHGALIFDFDDPIFLESPFTTIAICKLADAVTVSNEALARYARQYNQRVFILPTSIDLELYQSGEKKDSRIPTIGWIGTPSNLEFLRILNDPLRRLHESNHFVFRILTDSRFKDRVPLDSSLPVEVEEWTYPGFVGRLRTFDIGVCPLLDTVWTQGKSGYKVLEYMALQIPPIASAIGENCKIVKDGVNGYLVSTPDEWLGRMQSLLNDSELRARIGQAGRKTVEESYTIEKTARLLADVIISLDQNGSTE